MLFRNFNNIFTKSPKIKSGFGRRFCTTKFIQDEQQGFIVKTPHPSIAYPKVSIDQYVWSNFNKWMNKTALIDGITGRSTTYAKLRDHCRALAIRLRTSFNLQPNDTIAVCLANSIEFPIVALAGCEAELSITTINPIYTADEISRQLMDSNPKILFGEASMSNVLQSAVQKAKMSIKIVYVTSSSNEPIPSNGIRFSELIEARNLDLSFLAEMDRDVNSVSFLPYSSGTTGLNKGVMLSHMNIVSNSIALRVEHCGVTKDSIGEYQDVIPCVLPFFHIYGLVVTLLSKLAQGCKIITLPKFSPDTFLNVMEKYQGNVLHLVPPIVIFFNSYDKIKPIHTQSIEYVLCGAAPLGSSDIEKYLKKSPHTKYVQAYGCTEASPTTHMLVRGSKNYASVGVPINDTEVKIVEVDDESFTGLGPHTIGEILARGPQVMLGYHKNEEATRNTITPDGWLRTGDIGYYDESGSFYITDRLKELIKVKGFQVAPAELEEILRMHPEITDSAVIGVPNDSVGELPRAFVVIKKGSNLSEKNVQDFVAGKVADYKRLTGGVEFVDAIPKNATGKILRRELKKKFL